MIMTGFKTKKQKIPPSHMIIWDGRYVSAVPPKLLGSLEPASRQQYYKGYQPLGSSPTAPKVERSSLSPVRINHRFSEERYESQLLSTLIFSIFNLYYIDFCDNLQGKIDRIYFYGNLFGLLRKILSSIILIGASIQYGKE